MQELVEVLKTEIVEDDNVEIKRAQIEKYVIDKYVSMIRELTLKRGQDKIPKTKDAKLASMERMRTIGEIDRLLGIPLRNKILEMSLDLDVICYAGFRS